mmetsp:Transcript_5531/g.10085  ORF Transcript_5531/g.10085 Transcript_5531/m.10085 type:complete len:538 (-) Transcript_5531:162-1775(-)|eukprot:CAMPEP_0201606028 /NCGR_PEP_ID=MMETSP0492-20130828/5631_1 /ASSEMBLY_ACC=CAM_ASM_000837 /TAXON_ID=420259 /ORGANISM="Thalassiosira gravida, Strain GMp14c1" /LENGTH=537 /DNA_ID=CAMNT_0048070367 /DNA_START=299 /DNA_END=1912 /DNA_ORIENTATION=-
MQDSLTNQVSALLGEAKELENNAYHHTTTSDNAKTHKQDQTTPPSWATLEKSAAKYYQACFLMKGYIRESSSSEREEFARRKESYTNDIEHYEKHAKSLLDKVEGLKISEKHTQNKKRISFGKQKSSSSRSNDNNGENNNGESSSGGKKKVVSTRRASEGLRNASLAGKKFLKKAKGKGLKLVGGGGGQQDHENKQANVDGNPPQDCDKEAIENGTTKPTNDDDVSNVRDCIPSNDNRDNNVRDCIRSNWVSGPTETEKYTTGNVNQLLAAALDNDERGDSSKAISNYINTVQCHSHDKEPPQSTTIGNPIIATTMPSAVSSIPGQISISEREPNKCIKTTESDDPEHGILPMHQELPGSWKLWDSSTDQKVKSHFSLAIGTAGGPLNKGSFGSNPQWSIRVPSSSPSSPKEDSIKGCNGSKGVAFQVQCTASKDMSVNIILARSINNFSSANCRQDCDNNDAQKTMQTTSRRVHQLYEDPIVDTGPYQDGGLAVSKITYLPAGLYTLCASTCEAGQVGTFLLHVFSSDYVDIGKIE